MASLYTEHNQFDNLSVTVTNSDDLNAAIRQLAESGGGTIYVDGDGGPFDIAASGIGSAESPILIKALDPENPPTVHSVTLLNVEAITITEMRIDSSDVYTVREAWIEDIRISDSKGIEIVNNHMSSVAEGMLGEDADAISGEGLGTIRNSEDVVFSHNDISGYNQGIAFLEVKGLEFSNNEISGLQGDGFRGGGIQDAVISDNYMHDFLGTTQTLNHSDMIQLWGTNTVMPTKNIQITGNVLDSGGGAGTQSIFIRNESFGSKTAAGGYFENISISNNAIHNSSSHGISVSDTKGLTITDNTVLWNDSTYVVSKPGADPISSAPSIRTKNTVDSTVEGNIAGRIDDDGVSVTGDNIILSFDDPTSEFYVHSHFVNLMGTGESDIGDLRLKHDSELDGTYGAELSWSSASEGLDVAISASIDGGNMQQVMFSAEHSLLDGSAIDVATSQFKWVFDDGTVLNGPTVNAAFEGAGPQQVSLTVTTADGTSETIVKSFQVETNAVFALGFDGGAADSSGWDTSITDAGDYTGGLTGLGLKVDKDSSVTIGRFNDQLYNLRTFSIEMSMKVNDLGDGGTVMYMHDHFSLMTMDDGTLTFVLVTDDGVFDVSSSAGLMSEGGWHDIGISYDHFSGKLGLYVDDLLVGQSDATGSTAPGSYTGVIVGGSKSGTLKAVIDDLTMDREPIGGWVHTEATNIGDAIVDGGQADDGSADPDTGAGSADGGADTQAGGTDGSDPTVPMVLLHKSAQGQEYDLGAGDTYSVGRENTFLFSRDNFRIELDLETAQANVDGIFLDFYRTLYAQVDEQGHVRFVLTTDDGKFEVRTETAIFEEAGRHEIAFSYNSDEGLLQIEIDGVVSAQTAASGTTSDLPYWGLNLGSTFGTSIDAKVSNLEVYDNPKIAPVSEPDIDSDVSWEPDHFFSFEGMVHDEVDQTTKLRFWSNASESYADGTDGQAFNLDGQSKVGFERGEIELNDTDSFIMSFDFQRTELDEGGRVMHLHKVMDTYIDDDGFLNFQLTTESGAHYLVNDIQAFDDEDWHNVEIAYDGDAGILSLSVDGDVATLDGVTGNTDSVLYWGLTIGNTWGASVEGNIDNLAITDQVPDSYLENLGLI